MFTNETIFFNNMRLKRTPIFLCALALAPLCVARTKEDEVTTDIVGPHFSSVPDNILPSKPKPPEPEKPFWDLDRKFAILNGGRHRDMYCDSKPYLRKDVRNDPWWPNQKFQRPPKSISPKKSTTQRRPSATHRR